jgi:hypothetical protein
MHSTGLALTSALICLCWVGNGPLGGSALACLPAGLKGHPHHLLQGAAMSGQRDRSRSYHQRSSSTTRHARSGPERVHIVRRRTISTENVRTSGRRCRSRERRGRREDRPSTRSSRSPHRGNRRPAGDTRSCRSLMPPLPRPPLPPPDAPQPPPPPAPPPPLPLRHRQWGTWEGVECKQTNRGGNDKSQRGRPSHKSTVSMKAGMKSLNILPIFRLMIVI